jgi:uncharacterized iron-regulated protein
MKNQFFPLALIFLLASQSIKAQDLPAYKIYTQEGKEVKFGKMMKLIEDADIVLFGENHNNSIVHWLELQVTKAMYEQSPNLVISAEMLEADDQLIVNEYLAGNYDNKMFAAEAKLWKNYKTDYKPLVEFAKKNNLSVVAANIPRRYARMIYKIGITSLDSLTDEAKSYIAPIPFEIDLDLPGYKNIIETMKEHNPDDSVENMARAQAAKDATMAHFILQAFTGSNKIIHYVGAYHSNNFDGINYYLKKANANLKIITISVADQDDINSLAEDNLNLANFIISVPSDMTKTY